MKKNETGAAPPKKKAAPEPHFKKCVGVWFRVYGELIPPPPGFDRAKPSFIGAEPTQLKSILKDLRIRHEDAGYEWTEFLATKTFEAFIRLAYGDLYVRRNFMLRIISNSRNKFINHVNVEEKTKSNGFGTIGESIEFDDI